MRGQWQVTWDRWNGMKSDVENYVKGFGSAVKTSILNLSRG